MALCILSIILLLVIFLRIKGGFKRGWYLLKRRLSFKKQRITDEQKRLIQRHLHHFSYYRHLSPAGKEKFIRRVFNFMVHKEFKGANGLVVTDEMRILISASAIQLTFGLTDYGIKTLESIIIFPDIFQLNKRSPEYKGATTAHYMYLSWKSFLKGYDRPDDNLNLGLHEMTHALKLTLHLGQRFDVLFASRMEYWEQMVDKKFNEFTEITTFLRPYGLTNKEEFFAVCVEAFFENPENFKKELPEIFQLLMFLLNQHILNKTGDYELKDTDFENNTYGIPFLQDVKRSYKYSNSHWSLNLMVAGSAVLFPTVFYLSSCFVFSAVGYLFMFLLTGTIGLFQKKYFLKRNILSGQFFILYAYAGFGSCVMCLLLWLNFLIPVSSVYSEKYKISGTRNAPFFTPVLQRWNKPDTAFEGDIRPDNKLLEMLHVPHRNAPYIVFEYQYGIMGIIKITNLYYTDKE